jgi:hypothetical protein
MKTTMFTSLLVAVAAMVTSVAAVPAIQPLDVWVPKITSPTASTIWHLGHVCILSFCSLPRIHAYAPPSSQHQNVTWDTSDAPASISNKFSVVLDGSTCLSSTCCAERSQAVSRDADLRL